MATPPPNKRPKLDEKGKMEKNSKIYIDRNGNLKLVVGPNAVKMQVDANALRRASKVFNRMLFGPFKESTQTENWTVELPEDDPEALRVIFHAVHGNFGNVPQDLTLSKLYNVTVMADKYAMIGSLQLWGTNWTFDLDDEQSWRVFADKKETSYEDLQTLLVLYHFGSCSQFNELLAVLTITSKVDSNGQLLFRTTTGVDEVGSVSRRSDWKGVGALPVELIEFAQNKRLTFISRLLSGLTTVFESCTSENNANTERRCPSTALGLMIQRLVQERLWPVPMMVQVHLSVVELSRIAIEIEAEISGQILKKCKCPSGKRRSSRCRITLPRNFEHSWSKDIQKLAQAIFEPHFSSRDMTRLSDS